MPIAQLRYFFQTSRDFNFDALDKYLICLLLNPPLAVMRFGNSILFA